MQSIIPDPNITVTFAEELFSASEDRVPVAQRKHPWNTAILT